MSLSSREKEDYEKLIIDCPPNELNWLIGMLLYQRAKQRRETTAIQFKICDKCMRTYPFHTRSCFKCASDKLRTFSVKHNYEEILDGIRK